jgi:hypothetical protein
MVDLGLTHVALPVSNLNASIAVLHAVRTDAGGAPSYGIYMKLSVDSLHQSDGFVLFCQTLSEYLGRRVSFA